MAELVEAFEPGEVATIFSTTGAGPRPGPLFSRVRATRSASSSRRRRSTTYGRLRQSKERSINKVGHALHDLDPVFERFSRRPALAALVRAARPRRAAPSPVDVHLQAAPDRRRGRSAIRTRPSCTPSRSSVIGLWFALEDATTRERLPVCRTGRPQRAAPEPLPPPWHADRDRSRSIPTPLPSAGLRAARGRGGHTRRPARAPAARQRAQSLGPIAPRLHPARDRRPGALWRRQLAAARTGHDRSAASERLAPSIRESGPFDQGRFAP